MARRPNIFRELKFYRQEVISRLTDDVYSSQLDLEKRRLDALDELIRYVRSLSYVSHKDTKERLNYYLTESGLNCRTTAQYFGYNNVNKVEQTVKNASDKLRKIIGSTLETIMQASDIETIDEVIQKFRESPVQPGTYGYFLSGISHYLPSPKYDPSILLKDCEKELMWLGVFAHFSEVLLTQYCNQKKIAHILSLISTRNGSAIEREALKKYFDGQFNSSESGKLIPIQRQVNLMFNWLDQQNPYKSIKEITENATDGY
jgi:hypothetical protein